MEIDQPRLQLVFNVIAITSVTCLTLIWYLRKKDERKFTGRFTPERDSPFPPAPPAQSVSPQPAPSVNPELAQSVNPEQAQSVNPEQEQCDPRSDATPVALPAMDWDIRQFVTRRAEGWRAPSVSQWNSQFNSDEQAAPRAVSGGEYYELPLPHSQRIVFPRQQPKPAAVHHLAAPLRLCHSAPAARPENSLHSRGARMSPEVEAWPIG